MKDPRDAAASIPSRFIPGLFSLTLALGAGLLFMLELMVARLLLPRFGGAPAVWCTCVMVFQLLLLMGYLYAHLCGTRVRITRQLFLHLMILGLACFFVPPDLPSSREASPTESPAFAITLLLLGNIGLPFFILASTAPLLQRWFLKTGAPSGRDPYFLYGASNLGSLLALLAYPVWIEPRIGLAAQGRAWGLGFLVLLFLTVLCAARAFLGSRGAAFERDAERAPAGDRGEPASRPSGRLRARWVLLAFAPSSLTLGVTTSLSTNVAAIPLTWVLPLALYLLSFVVVFARPPASLHRAAVRWMPPAVAVAAVAGVIRMDLPKGAEYALLLGNLLLCCLVLHGELARTRPAAERLTEFYLWVSAGGLLGGLFNALAAPRLFTTAFEYPLLLIVCAALLPVASRVGGPGRLRLPDLLPYAAAPLVLVPLTTGWMGRTSLRGVDMSWLIGRIPALPEGAGAFIAAGTLALLCAVLGYVRRPALFGTGIASVLLAASWATDESQHTLHRERSFFGVLTVTEHAAEGYRSLIHGTTLHGQQLLRPGRQGAPVSYYHPLGPVGHVFSERRGRQARAPFAVIGLGVGSLAAYGAEGQEVDFYEIDPAVVRIARDPALFTFLSDGKARVRVRVGDGRLTLATAPAHRYGVILVDAFSSDSIPVHLLTKEALALYFSKLSPRGVLLVHITNSYLDLAPVLARAALEDGYAARICTDPEDPGIFKDRSTWVTLARRESDLGRLADRPEWSRLEPVEGVPAWTDDYSNLLSVFQW